MAMSIVGMDLHSNNDETMVKSWSIRSGFFEDGENTQQQQRQEIQKKKKKIEEDRPPPNITFTVDTLKELCCSIDLSISQRQQRIYLQQKKCQPLIKHFDNVRNQRRNHHRLVIPHNNMPRV